MRPGCCFLICPSREEADKAVAAYHNKRTLPGVWHSLPNIFPHLLSFHGDRLVEDLCFGFCLVLNEVILSASQASSPMQVKYADGELERLVPFFPFNIAGCAFLKYETKEQSLAALEALNGKHRMEVSIC
ncbi:hypothetical protein BHM03_00050565 [Ensete ventricosum]|nr:hypothetical protein BHM03_00050565 [Ensete ventricosum]